MRRLRYLIEWSELDAGYVATCDEMPELRGTGGENPHEALRALNRAVDLATIDLAESVVAAGRKHREEA